MLCYRDRAYCADTARCGTLNCDRRVTEIVTCGAAKACLPLALAEMWDTCTRRATPTTEDPDAQ